MPSSLGEPSGISYMFTSAAKLHFRGSAFVSMPQKPQASITAGSRYGFTAPSAKRSSKRSLSGTLTM
eukprot:Skav210001  [mRNA]  locus=scaffold3061:136194:136731:+ [translate_table: standard]